MNTNTHHHVIRPGQGEAVTPLEQIAEYARRTAHDARRPGREGWAHNSFHDLVLAHGRVFEPAPLPEDIYPALPGHCFKAATILADQHALTYVEGLVLLPDTRTVTEHAWCTRSANHPAASPGPPTRNPRRLTSPTPAPRARPRQPAQTAASRRSTPRTRQGPDGIAKTATPFSLQPTSDRKRRCARERGRQACR